MGSGDVHVIIWLWLNGFQRSYGPLINFLSAVFLSIYRMDFIQTSWEG